MVDTTKPYLDAENNMNKRVKIKEKLTNNRYRNSSKTRYMGYLYYHGSSILIDSPTNRYVDIHRVRRVKNINYLSEEGIPYYILSWDNCSQYFSNDAYAKSFDNLMKEP